MSTLKQVAKADVTRRDNLDVIVTPWSSVPGANVAPDGDFFAAGGDSLAAVRNVGALQHETGVALPATMVVRARTARVFAALAMNAPPQLCGGTGRVASSPLTPTQVATVRTLSRELAIDPDAPLPHPEEEEE